MLSCLRIRQLAIIDELELEPGPGLTVVTGETGAGKSILVDALQLVLGSRSRSEVVRTGAEAAEVEALFDLSTTPSARQLLGEMVGDAEGEAVVRRSVRAGGGSRAWLNGHLATAAQIARLTADLVEVCSQHEHHRLADPTTHLDVLDHYAGLSEQVAHMAACWQAFTEADAALEQAVARVRERTEREAVLRFQLEELDRVDPSPHELEDLSQELPRLAHADRLARATARAEHGLQAADGAVSEQIADIRAALDPLAGVDPTLDALVQQLDGAHAALDDVARDLGRYARGVSHDPERLAAVEERLAVLERLMRRHGGWEPMLDHRERARAELAELESLDDTLAELEDRRRATADAAIEAARRLHAARAKAAATLGTAITTELQELGMGNARVEVDVAHREARGRGLELDGAGLSERGMDRVTLLIAPNRGDPPRPLHRIASGGELSRALLAIKRVQASAAARGVYVFDEVDAGVGGAVAEVIGRKLAEVARHHQVICITHLPQIAVYGDVHFHVSKHDEDERTISSLRRLEGDDRVEELARMMGGIDIGDATRGAAAALLSSARPAAR